MQEHKYNASATEDIIDRQRPFFIPWPLHGENVVKIIDNKVAELTDKKVNNKFYKWLNKIYES